MAVNGINNSTIANTSNPKSQVESVKARLNSEELVQSELKGKEGVSKSRSDSVTLTDQAQTFSEIQKKLKKTPDVNSEKVASLKKAIQNGDYKIEGFAIANKMMDLEQDLDVLYS